jgi:hypothetical protein
MTITVRYSCYDCGLTKVSCVVPAREDEDVLVWMDQTLRRLAADHDQRSPSCHPTMLHDLMIPMSHADRIGGPPLQ